MSYSPTDKPTVLQLCNKLSSISDEWQRLAIQLPGIEMKHVRKIENNYHDIDRQKMALFEVWLEIHPGATWSNVCDALMKIDKVSLASSLVNKSAGSDIASSHMSLPHTPRQQLQIEEKDEEFIEESLTKLHETFIEIIYEVKMAFSNLVTHQPAQLHNVIRYAEEAVSPSQPLRFDASTIDDFFLQIRPYYDFLDCKVITSIAKRFIDGELVQKLKEHSSLARGFRKKRPIKQLAKELHQAFANTQSLPTLDAKLETPWEDVAIERLYVLIEHLLPNAVKKHPQYSLMNNIVISPGCLLLQYGIRDHSMIDTIIQHVLNSSNLMILVGVFQLAVGGIPVIYEDEDPSFSFNASLLDATEASNNVAVQCLLDIGANVNYQDDNGYTALMVAVSINNIDIIHQLLQADADVHIQGKNGATALIVACAGSEQEPILDAERLSDDYRDTVRLLLSHGADPLADVVVNGMSESPFDVACIWDNTNVVEMLLTDYNIPPEVVARGLYWAILNPAPNTIKLLQSTIPDVDPLAIKLGVSCTEGGTETVESLIEQVDPNTVIVHGLTPLMIASFHGHTSIADTLIYLGAKVNMVDDIYHHTALDWADNYDTVQLLQEHGGLCGQDIGSQDTPLDRSQDAPSDLQDMPTNESQDTPTTSRYKIPFTSLFRRIRKLGQAKKKTKNSLQHQPGTQPIQES